MENNRNELNENELNELEKLENLVKENFPLSGYVEGTRYVDGGSEWWQGTIDNPRWPFQVYLSPDGEIRLQL